MDIVIIGIGSRGDVQPYLALACSLRQANYQARLVAPPNFANLARSYGVPFHSAGVDFQTLLDNDRIKEIIESGRLIRGFRALRRDVAAVIDNLLREVWQACQGAELIVSTVIGPIGYSVAEKLNVPYIEAAMQPFTPTRLFPSPVAPTWKLGGAFNWLTHRLFAQALWQMYRANIHRFRQRVLGLRPHPFTGPMGQIQKEGVLRLYAYSPLVVPRPNDWPSNCHVTGYWFLPPPPDWRPPPELLQFLEDGPPPVYVGFGSMMSRDAVATTTMVIEALERANQRGVLAGGWGALDNQRQNSDRLFYVDDIPHDWLFPRMAAVVHHGGAGTTGATLRSGAPGVVVPFAFDQLFWGRQVAALGAGPPPLPRSKLTLAQLAAAIQRAVEEAEMGQRAALLGKRIQAEQGTAEAIALIRRVIDEKQRFSS